MRWSIALILCSLQALHPAWGEEITLRIGLHSVNAKIANTPQSREHGLMQQTQLCENCGMLFVFAKTGQYSFWMKDTPLPLSIAFITAHGIISNIAEMQAGSLDIHSSEGEILYALEMPQHWFARQGITAMNRVKGLEQAAPGR